MFGQSQGGGFRLSPKLLIALALAGVALFRYCSNSQHNEITGETQHISLSPDQEIAMGLQSAPEMANQFGGLSRNAQAAALVAQVGQQIVANSDAKRTPYQYKFHLLADPNTVNAFALPGGQIFITEGLLMRLTSDSRTIDRDMLAGVLGHEVGHVVARHSAERLAQMELAQGLTGAVTMATYDPGSPNSGAYIAQTVSNMMQLKYGRDQELESDDLGVRFMLQAGLNPEKMIDVMEILKQAAGPRETPEFQSTHPDPGNRQEHIRAAIEKYGGN